MNHYDIEICNAKLKVTVVKEAYFVENYIPEFKKLLMQNPTRVVGLDCKRKSAYSNVSILIMCFSNRCLIIQMGRLYNPLRSSLKNFFDDENIAFVGIETNFSFNCAKDDYCYTHNIGLCTCPTYSFTSGVQLGELASRVLKKPNLLKSGLAELAGQIDLKIKPTSEVGIQSHSTSTVTTTTSSSIEYKWDAPVFSEEQVKEAIHDAYYSYLIANKLLESL